VSALAAFVINFGWHEQELAKFSLCLMNIPSHFSNSYHKSFGFIPNFTKLNEGCGILFKVNKLSQNFMAYLFHFIQI
jgi:hypothetical protein